MTPNMNWLASYPKSGNTWMRIFISNLLDDTEEPADVNDLNHSSGSFARPMFDRVLGYNTGDLTADECARLRPIVYRWMNSKQEKPIYCKTHDACIRLSNGDWQMAPDITNKVLYILRNPLDVVISQANHSSTTFDQSVENLGNPSMILAKQKPTKLGSQVEQPMGTWSNHAKSWTENKLFNTLAVRYEDMNLKPLETFTKVATFLSLPDDAERIGNAVHNSSFDVLQAQEAASGFSERPQGVETFFRKGKVGDWQEMLSRPQIDKVVEDHFDVMRQYGYVDQDGNPQLA